MNMPMKSARWVVVFDAQCLLCNAWVRFLLRHDTQAIFSFASIQGRTGQALLQQAGLPLEGLQTLLLVNGPQHWQNTSAIFRILHALGWPWRAAWVLWCVPAVLRDAIYRTLARHRYKLFGRSDTCLVPPPNTASRFLD
jgi:predicted DCC family thiol-disulfide oxidoreductase YuxK